MAAVLGGTLLMLAAGLACGTWIHEKRQELRCVRALADALDRMEGMIRWQLLPLPRALERESERPLCGKHFSSILKKMETNIALQEAWRQEFSLIFPREAADILCRTELQGDAQQVMASLHYAAEQLRTLGELRSAEQSQKERLCVAAGASIAALLVIVLI